MPKKTLLHGNRRHFIKSTSVAAGALVAAPFVFTSTKTNAATRRVLGANDRIRIGVIGAGGKGSSDTDTAAAGGAEIVALCDVDKGTLENRTTSTPKPNQR